MEDTDKLQFNVIHGLLKVITEANRPTHPEEMKKKRSYKHQTSRRSQGVSRWHFHAVISTLCGLGIRKEEPKAKMFA